MTGRVTLHVEMVRILRENGGPMRPSDLTRAVNAAGRYRTASGLPVKQQQIHARARNYAHLFVSKNGRLGLAGEEVVGMPHLEEAPPPPAREGPPLLAREEWHWEGNVQAGLIKNLVMNGWSIERAADTASGERGVDVVARRGGEQLAREVKGYPSRVYARGEKAGRPKRTQPSLQAKHWLAGALLTVLRMRGSHPDASIAIALPDFPRYRALVAEIKWALDAIGVGEMFVHRNGAVKNAIEWATPGAQVRSS